MGVIDEHPRNNTRESVERERPYNNFEVLMELADQGQISRQEAYAQCSQGFVPMSWLELLVEAPAESV